MDKRKMDSQAIINSGILDKPYPRSSVPRTIKLISATDSGCNLIEDTELINGLNNGGIEASQYYGCWSVWKTGNDLYDGELLQYREVSETFKNSRLNRALEKIHEWFDGCDG